MSSPIDIATYSDALVVLGTAGIVVPLVRRSGLNPVIGFLAAGAVLGPLGLGSLVPAVPLLYWFTVTDPAHVAGIADLGIVFLLFLIGLELSFHRLLTMRRLVLGLGGLQFLLTSAVLTALLTWIAGQQISPAIIIASSLALSSTAIVLELLSSQGRMAGGTGRASFAVLLAQDIAVIPVLMFISIAGSGGQDSVWATLGKALGEAVIAMAAIALFGRFLMRPLFRQVAAAKSTELFIAAVLFVIVGAGVVAHLAGLSMALGAFVAGLLLAETEYEKAIQATVEPFKGLLLGIFFFTVGMNIDIRELLKEPVLLVGCVFGLIAIKAVVLGVLGKAFRLPNGVTIETALLLGPGGEFAFVGIAGAAALGVVEPRIASFVLAVTAVTMALTPLLSDTGRALSARLAKRIPPDPLLTAAPPTPEKPHALVVGYGRVGNVVCDMLAEHGVPFIAVDSNVVTVRREHDAGRPVYFGNASSIEFLKACGIEEATGVIITINSHDEIDRIVRQVRTLRSDILVVARARDAVHAAHLYAEGATNAVPETVEASLQLSEASLIGLGVAMGPVIASIHAKRDAVRSELQSLAKKHAS